tara:strand:- start:580 stop:681 length:102 start_codon:yes stop_codon:yes gene_type:complete
MLFFNKNKNYDIKTGSPIVAVVIRAPAKIINGR